MTGQRENLADSLWRHREADSELHRYIEGLRGQLADALNGLDALTEWAAGRACEDDVSCIACSGTGRPDCDACSGAGGFDCGTCTPCRAKKGKP